MNETEFKKTAIESLTKYQSILKMQEYDIRLEFANWANLYNTNKRSIDTDGLGAIFTLNIPAIVDFCEQSEIHQVLDNLIIQLLLCCVFYDIDDVPMNESCNIVSNIIKCHAENMPTI